MLAVLLLLVGIGIGIFLAFSGGLVSYLFSQARKKARISEKNLSIAEAALRRVANPTTGSPTLEADIALREIETNTYRSLEGN